MPKSDSMIVEPTDLAGFDAALDVDDRGDEPRPHRLHQEAVPHRVPCRPSSRACAALTANRLLAEHVLARPQRGDGHLAVARVGRRDVDDVDVGIGEQIVVGPVGARDPESLRELVGRVLGP